MSGAQKRIFLPEFDYILFSDDDLRASTMRSLHSVLSSISGVLEVDCDAAFSEQEIDAMPRLKAPDFGLVSPMNSAGGCSLYSPSQPICATPDLLISVRACSQTDHPTEFPVQSDRSIFIT